MAILLHVKVRKYQARLRHNIYKLTKSLTMTKYFDPRITLFDIRTFSKRCLEFTKDLSLEQLKGDLLTFSAVQYLLMILAEAIKRLPAKEEKYQLGSHRKLFIELGDGLIQNYDNAEACKILNSI